MLPLSELRYFKALKAFFQEIEKPAPILDTCSDQGNYASHFLYQGHGVLLYRSQHQPVYLGDSHQLHYLQTPSLTEAVIPYRHYAGMWLGEHLVYAKKEDVPRILELVVNWLDLGGVLWFCFLPGEGQKAMQEQYPTGVVTYRQTYYDPLFFDSLLTQLQAPVIQAWEEQHGGRTWIHVLAKRIR